MWWILEEKFQSTLNRSTYHKRKRIKKKNKNRLHRISKRRNREDKMQNKFAYGEPIAFHEYTQPEEEFIRANTYLELMRDVNGNPFLVKGNFSYGEMLVLTAASKEEGNEKRR